MRGITLKAGRRTGKRLPASSPAQNEHPMKRRRSRPSHSAVAPDASTIWECLPGDLVLLIAWRVLASNFLDYVRFRAVCTLWRSATVCPRGRGIVDPRFHPRRWKMLPEGHGLYPGHGKLRGFVRFFNLDTGAIVRAKLPLFRNHCALDTVDTGLMVLQRDEDTTVRLLHPFTGDTVDLPPLATADPQIDPSFLGAFSDSHRRFYIRSVFATSCSVDAAGVVTVMLALNRMSSIAYATSGDRQWTLSRIESIGHTQLISFRGKLYVAGKKPTRLADPEFFRIDPPLGHEDGTTANVLPPPKLIATCRKGTLAWPVSLVDSGSEILVVGNNTDPSPSAPRLLVLRLADLMSDRFIPLKSIGGRAIFIESSCTLCVCAKALPTVQEDTVVQRSKGGVVEQFSLATAASQPALDDDLRFRRLPAPCSLIRHILTCCTNIYWNKGLLHSRQSDSHSLKWRVKGKFRDGA